jgi:hypothetical protein
LADNRLLETNLIFSCISTYLFGIRYAAKYLFLKKDIEVLLKDTTGKC